MSSTIGRFTSFAVVAMTAVFLACEESPTSIGALADTQMAPQLSSEAGNPVVMSASGSGSYLVQEGERRTFSFNALQRADGSITGQVQMKNRFRDVIYHGRISARCADIGAGLVAFAVLDTNVRGELINDPNLLPGTGASLFVVRDNGEGAGAAPDELTGIEFTTPGFAAAVCANPAGFGFTVPVVESLLNTVEAGNIQVNW